MSFEVSGSTWVPKSALEHAQSMLDAMNTVLRPLGKELTPSMTNVIWWICLGLGDLASTFDDNLSSAKDSFNLDLCDDDQLQNLLPITGVTRIPGSYSTISATFLGDATGQTVPAGTHVKVQNQDALFVLDEDLVVPPSTSVSGACTCDTIGEIYVLSSQVTGTVETLPHIVSVTNASAAIAGSAEESLTQVRRRIVNGLTIKNNLDGLATELRSLPGIQYAAVYFNPSSSAALVLPGAISLPARNMYIVIKGASDRIADTFAKYSMATTYGAESQPFVSLSGQSIAVHYGIAGETPVHVQVYVDTNKLHETGYAAEIKALILTLAPLVEIGQAITQEMVASLFINFQYATINGVNVSLNGSSWGRVAVVDADNVATFSDTNITVTLE
jgi:hypothetical protein